MGNLVVPLVIIAPGVAAVLGALMVSSDERVVVLDAPMWVAIVTAGLVGMAALGLGFGLWWLYRGAGRVVSGRRGQTQLTKARQQWLMESRGQNAAFLARLDRELRGPAMAIHLSMASLGDNTRPAMVAAEQAARITQLVSDLGALAEVETTELEFEPVPFVPLVEQVIGEVRRDPALCPPGRHISVLPPTLADRLVVSGAPDMLAAVVRHLVVNALRFSAPDGTITVHCVDDGTAVLEVVDTGRGIPPGEVDLVWETLARGSNTEDVPGFGLGLALVRAVVERHGGVVDLSSRLGEGTSVHVRLPLDMGMQRGFVRRPGG